MSDIPSTLPIGVFDSGVGGLTVLRALRQELPQASFVYLGDTARLPYGTKSPTTVVRYAQQASGRLVGEGVQALVVACNTASAYALPALQATFPSLPVFGVVEPGAEHAAEASRRGAVALLATESTVRGGAYQSALLRRGVRKVYARPASLLVALAEEGRRDDGIATAVVHDYLTGLANRVDTLLLGCTHFPVFARTLNQQFPDLSVVDSAATTARAVRDTLGLVRVEKPTTRYLATDGVTRFKRVGAHFLGEAIGTVELVDL